MKKSIILLKHLFPVLFLMLAACSNPGSNQVITVETLLDELISYDQPTLFPEPYYTCKQVSSYDRRSLSPDQSGWFANNDGFGCISSDTIGDRIQMLMFDEEGPGAITRIWMTTSNKQGVFKFYFNHSAEPDWVVDGFDFSKTGLPILDGLVFRHTHYKEAVEKTGGNTFFLPIPYARHCKIVFEYPVSIGNTSHYYQVNYRTYQPDINVETFDFDKVKTLVSKLETVSKTLQQPPVPDGEIIENAALLGSGKSMLLDCPEGNRAIRQLRFHIKTDSSRYAEVMRKLVVKVQFDGKETIWVPLSDFSGGGFGAPYVKSWYLNADGAGDITVRWVMPYQKNARIELINYSVYDVNAAIHANVDKYRWDSKRSLYFHAGWRQENGIQLCNNPDEGCIDWRFAEIKGRGVYAGDLLALFNHSPAWYGEGDEKIWIDDDVFPSHFGTGTEDYYNCSWAPVVPFHTPFGGAPRADLASSHGYNAFMRTRNLDVIPFREKFVFDIEMISWRLGTVDYATTVYWYGDRDAVATGCSGEEEVKRDLLPAPPNPADM